MVLKGEAGEAAGRVWEGLAREAFAGVSLVIYNPLVSEQVMVEWIRRRTEDSR